MKLYQFSKTLAKKQKVNNYNFANKKNMHQDKFTKSKK